MTVDPWAGKFCCQIETLYGRVDLRSLVALGIDWARTCFTAYDGPSVSWSVAVGPDFDVRPLTESVIQGVEDGDLELTDEGFEHAAAHDFARVTDSHDTREGRSYDSSVVHVVLGARHVRVVYSHLFGDETVFYPKSRRLLLAACGLPPVDVPPLNDRRPLTGRRIVGAAAHVFVRRPTVAARSMRRIVQERTELSDSSVSSMRIADPESVFVLAVTVEKVRAAKIPSVLFYCSVLRDLQLPPTVVHHVVTDIRSYSDVLTGTGGNAVSHVPFVADFSTRTPDSVASSVSARIRQAEPSVRAAAARVFGLRESRSRVAPIVASDRVPLVTTMSYYRLPPGQQLYGDDGAPTRTIGFQNPDLGVLAFNARDCDGRAHFTVSHRGGLIDRDRLMAAMVVSAARVGCRVSWSLPDVDAERRVVTIHENGAALGA
ncbi:hypothetical protein [Rhodococcus sp. MEB064]|uniref:hypothetical protein n=1 Tax=Rhodococcus sp. MEB064 TaxID=1587522 RepID=UPI0005AC89A8|nr:hypothetical protein [Rhodococcus sp. MEB064]KIQ11792.1 hypothetical protein RU01_18530 [Rhodococcus sp. MEB064]